MMCRRNQCILADKTVFCRITLQSGYTRRPCKRKSSPMNEEYRKLCQREIKDLLKRILIRESNNPWNCYGLYVNKLSKQIRGVPRLVIKYRPLNNVFIDDTYPIPHKGNLISKIAGAKIFSKFDMKSRISVQNKIQCLLQIL